MPTASEKVAEELRARIVRGYWGPGSRLPTRTKLISELGSCADVVQEAVKQLAAEGFLEVGARKKGTRVAPNPPHLARYRVVFPFGPDDWGQFWHALEDAARERTTENREFACFYGLGGHRDIADFEAVVNEVRTRSVAGLIFASSAQELAGTPLLEAADVPRVAIAGEGRLPGVPKVQVDLQSFVRQAVGRLVAQGRQRLAMLCASRAPQILDLFRDALATHGLVSRPHWEQLASMRKPIAARHVMQLMLHSGQLERPDGLIIADDNLIAGATDGIVSTGMRVPDELAVVAMTNFPHILPSAVPLTRIGFDIPAVLDLLTERLTQVASGQPAPEVTTVPAITEQEYEGEGAGAGVEDEG